MKRFTSILLPLDGSPEAAKGAGCALWLAEALGATLHVLHAAKQPLPGNEALARLHVVGAKRPDVVVHQLLGKAEDAVLSAITTYEINLVVMSARGESASVGLKQSCLLGTVAHAIIERSPVPVILLPIRYHEEIPWTSMLAAASGDMAADHALETAVRLAASLRLKLTVLHVENGPGAANSPLKTYADSPHYEYPSRMDEMVKRGLSGCTPEECSCIEQVLLRRGDPASVLLEQAALHASAVLALGWHGVLEAGRALVFKRLLEEAKCPLLLVRKDERSSARLKVGKEIDE
ncbi:universal stress protein [Oxalobacteraceae bacterium R-40]|uniref:Universal stress protein n=1 Tax=Keguizhuia sedimenti TaxID=3064264 RepID=A0ABU1BT57_9BURK|nr:universal stress protein [Oxalobacteraceae bacterium R-40]